MSNFALVLMEGDEYIRVPSEDPFNKFQPISYTNESVSARVDQ
jgi:hypothetical protein